MYCNQSVKLLSLSTPQCILGKWTSWLFYHGVKQYSIDDTNNGKRRIESMKSYYVDWCLQADLAVHILHNGSRRLCASRTEPELREEEEAEVRHQMGPDLHKKGAWAGRWTEGEL